MFYDLRKIILSYKNTLNNYIFVCRIWKYKNHIIPNFLSYIYNAKVKINLK